MKFQHIFGCILVVCNLTVGVLSGVLLAGSNLGGQTHVVSGATVIDSYTPLNTRHGIPVGIGSSGGGAIVTSHTDPPGHHGNTGLTDRIHTQTIIPSRRTIPLYHGGSSIYSGTISGSLYPQAVVGGGVYPAAGGVYSGVVGGVYPSGISHVTGIGGLGGLVETSSRQKQHHSVESHIDGPYMHGNHRGVPAVHTTRVTRHRTSSRPVLRRRVGGLLNLLGYPTGY